MPMSAEGHILRYAQVLRSAVYCGGHTKFLCLWFVRLLQVWLP